MKSKSKKNQSIQTEYSPIGMIVFWGMIISITSLVFMINTSMKINEDYFYGVLISFLIYPLLGVYVAWKNSEPEQDSIFSKFKSLFTAGLWYSVLSAILFFTGIIFSEDGINLGSYLFFGGAIFSLLASIGHNSRTKYSYRRSFGDALAMSMGQLIIVFFILLAVGAILNKFSNRR